MTSTSSPTVTAPAERPLWAEAGNGAELARLCERRLDELRARVATLVAPDRPRTLDATLALYDDLLTGLEAVASQASLIENVHPDRSLREAAERATQQAAAFGTELSLHRGVYDALSAIDLDGADATTRHYVTKTLREFRLAGVDRDEATRARVRALHEELVAISQEFSRNIRSDQRAVPARPEELEGLPADFVARHDKASDGTVLLTIDTADALPVFLYAANPGLRRRMYMEFNNRAHPANLPVLDRLIAKRHELATLLGFAHWADYVTADKMVESAAKASAFVDRIVEASGPRAGADYERLLARKRRDHPEAAVVEAWESSYWSELVRRAEYDFDSQAMRPYFPFARVKQGVLDVTSTLFGVTFRRQEGAPVWHPAVECWEMFENGALTGRFYLDLHPRPDKYNHAAQFDIRTGVAGKQIPEAALVCNFAGGLPGDPGLLEYTDVRTFFHEFGHLLHTLFGGRHRWLGVGGIRTEQDFVEVPSQLLEEWTQDPATLATFARHHRTDEPIPATLVRQMVRASEFGKGLQVRRQMVFARVSLSCYDRDPAEVDTDAIVRRVTEAYQPYPFVEGTHLQTSFGHLDGYSAVYYTYMWSLVIAKDVFARFDRDDLLDSAAAARFRDLVLARGGTMPAAQMVNEFLGRPFDFEAWRVWLDQTS